MSLTVVIIIVLSLGIIVSGILLLKQSAKKFKLSDKQLEEIKKRNDALAQEEKEE